MANKPKSTPVKPQSKSPVAQPGRRISGQEAKSVKNEEILKRVNKSGGLSIDEAASLYDELGKG